MSPETAQELAEAIKTSIRLYLSNWPPEVRFKVGKGLCDIVDRHFVPFTPLDPRESIECAIPQSVFLSNVNHLLQ